MTEESKDHPQTRGESFASPEEIGEFLLSLIQAFLRTGYYLPEHPESKKAKIGLYDKFARLVGEDREVTFLLRETGAATNVYIEGLSLKPLRLADTMLKGMADTYNPRFVNFLERKELVSLSINSRMGAEEFSRLIDLISEPFLEDMKEHAVKERFLACLKEREIQHLSFVFNEDFISERRNIPWRAALALSRLRKDISLIPIFRNLQREEIGQVRKEILSDILRPLNVPELVYAFLMNLDLTSTADLSEEDAENVVFSLVKENVFINLTPIFIKDASGKEKKYRDILHQEKFARILGKLCQRLNKINRHESRTLMEDMFNAGLLSMEDLPAEVRERVMTVQLAMNFLEKKENYLKHFDQTNTPDEYSRRSHLMAKIIPYLIERGQYLEAVEITDKLVRHGLEKSERSHIAEETIIWLAKSDALAEAHKAFLTTAKEGRISLGRFFVLLGPWAAPHLLSIINEANDSWKRKNAVELLTQIGPEAASSLIFEIEQCEVPAEIVATIIRVLGNVADEKLRGAAARIIKEKAGDQDRDVRRESLLALCRLAPFGEFDIFKAGLDDHDEKIKKAALRGLGLAGDSRALGLLTQTVEESQSNNSDESWEVMSTAIDALGHLYESCLEVRGKIADYTVELASRGYPQKTWKRLVGRAHILPTQCLLALAEALGRIRSAETTEILHRMAEGPDKSVARKASEILKKASPG